MTNKKAVSLLSGGLDSTVCTKLAVDELGAENVIALTIIYGQKHVREVKSAQAVTQVLGIRHVIKEIPNLFDGSRCALVDTSIEMPKMSYMEVNNIYGISPVYVPFRNGILLSIATALALIEEAEQVYYAPHMGDYRRYSYPDCSPDFVASMNKAMFEGTGKHVRLETPLLYLSKKEIVQVGLKIKAPLELTWSCYEGGDVACGECPTCVERIKAFQAVGKPDPISYKTPISW